MSFNEDWTHDLKEAISMTIASLPGADSSSNARSPFLSTIFLRPNLAEDFRVTAFVQNEGSWVAFR